MKGQDGRGGTADCHQWRDRLSEYLDRELLEAEECRQVEEHLSTCSECRTVLDELRQVSARGGRMRADSEPTTDLWPAVARRLTPRATIAVPTAVGRPKEVRRRPRWMAPALAAAAAVVLACAATLGWWLRRAPAGEDTTDTISVSQVATPPTAADREYEVEIAGLQRVVRTHLTYDPHVVVDLERNLARLDVAIADYRKALSQQPGDSHLQRRFKAAREQKLEVLRQAATLAAGGSN